MWEFRRLRLYANLPMANAFFLPGAGASASFWRPVADRLSGQRQKIMLSWPGLGSEPPAAGVRGIDDLVSMLLAELGEPADLIAQSMGGLVAIRAALAAPARIRRMVLAATSAGVPVDDLGGSDWRPEYRKAFPAAAAWITEVRQDLSTQMASIAAPVLLLWGDADSISPIAVGRRLLELLPNARLHVVKGGGHDLAVTHADEVAAIIQEHLDAT
jgi:pimeloyl-ACP methyl ester carboxylesterase